MCSPTKHHADCYYARHPKGHLPPGIAELELRRLIAEDRALVEAA
jgi:hypothetical protein